jgi:hypothetical protein
MIRAPRSLPGISGREVDMRKTLAIAAIGLAGFLGVAACGTAHVLATPVPQPSAAPTNNNNTMAREIANIAVGKGGLTALHDGYGQATLAYCDPGTVSRPRNVSTPTSVSCGIKYSDGSVWKQTVTVAFDSHGNPIADLADLGTEVLRPSPDDGPVTCKRMCPN